MTKKILTGLVAVIAILLIVISLQPGDFRVERSAPLAASPADLFEQVNDHHKFARWNPWMELDPNVKNTYSGAESGVGAICSWQGDSNVGAGTSTIIESKPNELVRFKMDWKEPMQGTSTVDFTFKPAGYKTVVTWAMYGPQSFMGKAVSLVMDCEKMCGPQFEKGLTNLERAATSPAPIASTRANP